MAARGGSSYRIAGCIATAAIAGVAQIIDGRAQPGTLAVIATDAHTLDVQLAGPTPYFLYLLTNCWLVPLHEATLRKYGTAWTEPGHLVGNGAFVLKSHAVNGPVELLRNPATGTRSRCAWLRSPTIPWSTPPQQLRGFSRAISTSPTASRWMTSAGLLQRWGSSCGWSRTSPLS